MTQRISHLGSTPRRLLATIFVVSFLVYQTTLAVTAVKPFPDFWFFGADSYRVALTNIPARNWHPMAIYQAKKHPLFIALSTPLHQLGRFVYGGMPEPLNENMPLSFPPALFGALNLCVAYLLFRKIGFPEKQALLPTTFYGAAAAVWIFASFPETYSCTSLFTNLFILAFLADTKLKSLRGLVFTHVLVCFAAPQQVLLGVIPLFQLLRVDGFRVGIHRAVRYGLMLCVLFVLPYLIICTVQEKKMGMSIAGATLPYDELEEVGAFRNLANPESWLVTASTFLLLSQVAMAVPPQAFEPLTIESILLAPFYNWLLVLAVLIYAVGGLARGGHKRLFDGSLAIFVFCIIYMVFFVYCNPTEAFLYCGPMVLPLWLLIHGTHSPLQPRRWSLRLLGALCVLITLNNGVFAVDLRNHESGHGRVGQALDSVPAEPDRPEELKGTTTSFLARRQMLCASTDRLEPVTSLPVRFSHLVARPGA